MVKKKKRKTRKKKYKPFDLQDGETPKDYLRRRARESGFSDVNDRDEFPPKWIIYFGIILIVLFIMSFFHEPTSVNECAKGFSGLVPCHCYTESLPARCI